MQFKPLPSIPEMLTITSNRILIRRPYEEFFSRRNLPEKSRHKILNKEANKLTGEVTRNVRCRMKSAIDGFISAIEAHNQTCARDSKHLITFVTLTISASQMHSDKELNRLLLMPMIQKLMRNKAVVNYIWKAEKQSNGNIHWHILIDRYVHWRWLRDAWNATQALHGYLDNYQSMHGHQDANSTDIHRLKGIHNIAAYITKYICKNSQQNGLECRVWGCSAGLKAIKQFRVEVTSEVHTLIEDIVANASSSIYSYENCFICTSKRLKSILFKHRRIYDAYQAHHLRNYQTLYRSELERVTTIDFITPINTVICYPNKSAKTQLITQLALF